MDFTAFDTKKIDEYAAQVDLAGTMGGSMTENIDRAGGEGTAEFVTKAIRVYCG